MSRTASRLSLALLLSAGIALCAPAARAEATEPDKARAEQIKSEGDKYMLERRYGEALDAYGQSFALQPDPRLFYNRGNAYMALERYPEALEQLESFRERAPEALKKKVPALDELIDGVRAKVSTLEIVTRTRGARVLFRGQVVGATPLEGPLKVNAGPGSLEVLADGYEPWKKDVELAGGGTLRLELNLVARAGTTLLVVRSPVPGARVALDARDLGSVPAEAKVSPGTHRVVLTHPDYESSDVSVVLGPGEHKKLDVRLEEKKPITAKWWFWTGIGVVVAGTVATVVALSTERAADRGDIEPRQVATPLVSF